MINTTDKLTMQKKDGIIEMPRWHFNSREYLTATVPLGD